MRHAALRAIAVSLVLTVALAGCSALEEEPTREVRAVDALDDAHAALEDVETYRYESEMTVDADRQRIDVSLFGAVDHANETLYTNATVAGESLESYVDDGTLYEQCPSPWGGWNVEDVEDEPWPEGTPAHAQLSLFEEGDLYWNGTETIDGREAVRLTGSPPADAFDGDLSSGSPLDFGGPTLDDASTTLWLDAETDRPLKTAVEFSISESGESATASLTMEYAAYDDPVSIDVPPEATDGHDQYERGCPGA